jgi:hypothetical protein
MSAHLTAWPSRLLYLYLFALDCLMRLHASFDHSVHTKLQRRHKLIVYMHVICPKFLHPGDLTLAQPTSLYTSPLVAPRDLKIPFTFNDLPAPL